MSNKPRILFVCTGNICRSPMAEGLMKEAAEKEALQIDVFSAGTSGLNGSPASAHTLTVLKQRGISLPGFKSQQVTKTHLEEATHIFALAGGHLQELLHYYPEGADKTSLITDCIENPKRKGKSVPDPYGGPLREYEKLSLTLDEAIQGIIKLLKQTK